VNELGRERGAVINADAFAPARLDLRRVGLDEDHGYARGTQGVPDGATDSASPDDLNGFHARTPRVLVGQASSLSF
jgi:hypothetical protein